MKGLHAIQELFKIRNDLLGDKVSNKANKNWKNDIEIYDKIGFRLFTIEKELKALEIIDKYLVDIYMLKTRKTLEEYNKDHRTGYPIKTQEEFDLLKEIGL